MSKTDEVQAKPEDEKAKPKVVTSSEEIARLLGADRVVPIERGPSKGPLEWLALRKKVRKLKDEAARSQGEDREECEQAAPSQEAGSGSL